MNQTMTTREKKDSQVKRPYETPRIQPMSEREILNTFQITQAMQTWWVAGC